MKIAMVAVTLLLMVAIFASCRDKNDPPDENPPFPRLEPPLGVAFSAPDGQATFFSLTEHKIVATTRIQGWSLSANFNDMGTRLYCVENFESRICSYRLPEFTLEFSQDIGGTPLDIHPNAGSNILYITTQNGRFWRYTPDLDEFVFLFVGLGPRRMALRPLEETEAWVACASDMSIHIIDLSRFIELDTIRCGYRPTDLCFSPDGHKVYYALKTIGRVYVMDISTRTLLDSVSVGTAGPYDLSLSTDSRYLAISDSTRGMVTVWDLPNRTATTLNVGFGAGRVRFVRDVDDFYVMSSYKSRILKISMANGTPVVTDSIFTMSTLTEFALWENLN